MPEYNYKDAEAALSHIKNFIHDTPKTAIISGSGLGGIANIINDQIILDAENTPNWPVSTAPGHAGKIIIGKISGRPVIMLQGRLHYYEGYSMKAIAFPARVLAMMGVREIIITNASGAVNKDFKTGDIIAVRDHINLMGDNPLRGPNDSRWNERFPDMTYAYDKDMLKIFESMGLKQGVYAGLPGPSFETPSEVRMLRILGADLAGMSTVPEVIAANAMKLKIAVLSCVSNMCAGIEPNKIQSGQEVLDAMKDSSGKVGKIIQDLIKILNRSEI